MAEAAVEDFGSGNFGFDGVVQIPADAPQPAGTVKGCVQHLVQPRLGLDEILIGRFPGAGASFWASWGTTGFCCPAPSTSAWGSTLMEVPDVAEKIVELMVASVR